MRQRRARSALVGTGWISNPTPSPYSTNTPLRTTTPVRSLVMGPTRSNDDDRRISLVDLAAIGDLAGHVHDRATDLPPAPVGPAIRRPTMSHRDLAAPGGDAAHSVRRLRSRRD